MLSFTIFNVQTVNHNAITISVLWSEKPTFTISITYNLHYKGKTIMNVLQIRNCFITFSLYTLHPWGIVWYN